MEKRANVRGAAQDLVLLDKINEDEVVSTLQNRFSNDKIYTFIGEVLVSVNPFRDISGLYSNDLMRKYTGRNHFEVAPHVYASAEYAFRLLKTHQRSQCVIISGESGAGKTEAAKKFLEYVTVVSQDRAEIHSNISVGDIKDSLLRSNPVIEAFGNAKTLRNKNSSRFGKYLVIKFDYSGAPLGGYIHSYLLEKPRVVYQQAGERNFHVFYQLCTGALQYPELGISRAEDFAYIRGTTKAKGIDDEKGFRVVSEAMDHVGISETNKKYIFRLIAAILHLGNIEFETAGGESCKVSSKSNQGIDLIANLLNLNPSNLCRALTFRTVTSGTESVSSPLVSVIECEKSRDALAKALYGRNFLSLLGLMNDKIKTESNEMSMGVLDIYGFEIFEHNGFEQLCINYCNEKLQQLFIELTLKKEQEEYDREGIKWTKIEYFNNKIVCDLIENRKPAGVLAFLNEECLVPRGTDKGYATKLDRNLKNHPHFESYVKTPKFKYTEFLIKHYAGDVIYDADGMMDKNKDPLFHDLKVLMQGSKTEYFANLMPEAHDGKTPVTVSSDLVKNMKQLIDDLNKCEPHYIRTIKSNGQEQGNRFEPELVKHQVRYLGIVENVRVRRAGFAFRCDFNYFVNHFKIISKETWPRGTGDVKADIMIILKASGIKRFEMGITKVFIESPEDVFNLEDAREEKLNDVARMIQKAYRLFQSRILQLRRRTAAAELLHSRKRRCKSWAVQFHGDYQNSNRNSMVKRKIGNEWVQFSDFVDVLNLSSKLPMKRSLFVLTDKGIYFFFKHRNADKISLNDVSTLRLSTFADGFMVFTYNVKKKGLPSTLIFSCVRKAELCIIFQEYYHKMMNRMPVIEFKDSFPVTLVKKKLFWKKVISKTLNFRESDALKGRNTRFEQPSERGSSGAKNELFIYVSTNLGKLAPYQLNSEFPPFLLKFKVRPASSRLSIALF